ncbi:MAG: hypothetical protein A2X86_10360 [Bdellovibrionales bacterium GWA2_49_15]|nr:MAG: hypothetical protein A2X86_10360 [Bdellovibrionales bacterium GWA2_49_15]
MGFKLKSVIKQVAAPVKAQVKAAVKDAVPLTAAYFTGGASLSMMPASNTMSSGILGKVLGGGAGGSEPAQEAPAPVEIPYAPVPVLQAPAQAPKSTGKKIATKSSYGEAGTRPAPASATGPITSSAAPDNKMMIMIGVGVGGLVLIGVLVAMMRKS